MHRFFKNLTRQQVEIGLYALLIIVLAVCACFLLWASGGVWLTLWKLFCSVIEPLAYGFMLSYVLNPLVSKISHLLRDRNVLADDGAKRRSIAVIITIALIALVLLGIMAGFALMVVKGVSKLNWQVIQDLIAGATSDVMGFVTMVRDRLVNWGLISEGAESTLLNTVIGVSDVVSTIVFSAMFTIYFLIDGERLFKYFHRVTRNVLGEQGELGSRMLNDADRVFSGYFRGQATDALMVGVLSALLLTIASVPYAPIVGALAGIGNLIPYLGGPIGYGSVVLVCLPDMNWPKMIWGVVVMSVVMFVDGNIINPKLLSNSVEVHPMLVMIALIAGGAVGGIAGMLVAVPTAAWLKIQLDRWMDKNEALEKSASDQGASDEG